MIDISLNLDELRTFYPGSQPFIRKQYSEYTSQIMMDSHCGTHMDAPSHFIPGGKTINDLNPELFYGLTTVIRGIPDKITTDCVFFRYNDILHKNWAFVKDYVGLNKVDVEWILDNKIKVVGIDYLSIEPYIKKYNVHEVLLKNDVLIIEGLNLFDINDGIYKYYAFPLRSNGEGSPARVILDYV